MNSKYFKIDAKPEKGAGVSPFYGIDCWGGIRKILREPTTGSPVLDVML